MRPNFVNVVEFIKSKTVKCHLEMKQNEASISSWQDKKEAARDRERHRETERDRERQRELERGRERQRDTERDRQTWGVN